MKNWIIWIFQLRHPTIFVARRGPTKSLWVRQHLCRPWIEPNPSLKQVQGVTYRRTRSIFTIILLSVPACVWDESSMYRRTYDKRHEQCRLFNREVSALQDTQTHWTAVAKKYISLMASVPLNGRAFILHRNCFVPGPSFSPSPYSPPLYEEKRRVKKRLIGR